MQALLVEYRFLIWTVGGTVTLWLLLHLPTWKRVAQGGSWNAERDYAAWRVRKAVLLLGVLVPLLIATTAAVIR